MMQDDGNQALSHSSEKWFNGQSGTLQHPYSKALILLQGSCQISIANVTHRAICGDLVCIPPGTPYAIRCDDCCRIGEVVFHGGVHDLVLQKIGLFHDEGDTFRRTFEIILEIQDSSDAQIKAVVYCLHCALYGILTRLGNVARQSHIDQVDAVFRAIQQNFMNPNFDLSGEIEKTGYSASHFRRMFREMIGRPPLQQLNLTRINFAKTQMQIYGDRYSLKQLSQNAGFRDPFFFSRMFSKFVGVSPTEYLQQLKKG